MISGKATDITYIPMHKGFCYLVAIMDLFSRKILAWRLSNTLDKRFCIEALAEALSNYPKPDIFNTDQGAQFTSYEFTSILKQNNIQVSMDSKGRWIDNVFRTPLRQRSAREDPIHSGLERAAAMIKRFWRSLKYEEVYLRAYQSIPDAKVYISNYIQDYNHHRRHSSLDKQTPNIAYTQSMNRPVPQHVNQQSFAFTSRPCS